MTRVRSFPPIAAPDARVLVLGSMPGEPSLKAWEYYANKQNHFWRILGELLGFEATAPYVARMHHVQSARVAVWDVLLSCEREGSLDSAIKRTSREVNDFQSFFAVYTKITHIFFNGGAAESCFCSLVLPRLGDRELNLARLPSTSPANASYSFARKLAEWRAILEPLA